MAFTSRILTKSRQLYGNRVILPKDNALPVRSFAKEAARPALKEMVRHIPWAT
ncbi:hypothetical protein SAY86_026663 [Trapa natans]|uniref:Uncharacterized protein n=1 Tax=Trapa natans TaxID=22666 RepID=A0AAN7QFA0_TRANT|nr:hypothetical protein SAY86_026663 [Trapa natans]